MCIGRTGNQVCSSYLSILIFIFCLNSVRVTSSPLLRKSIISLPPFDTSQDTTFNQNLSYTILSWPEDHVQDLLELWRLQVLFFTTIIFNILVSALLFFTDNPDR